MIGPTLIFDKSTLESLSVDESVWLETFFSTNITPLFFVETLADLEKAISDGRAPEEVVGRMAEKTPSDARPNVHHQTLCLAELVNRFEVVMDGRPIVEGAQEKRVEGTRAIVVEEGPEFAALHRWRERRFLEAERRFALGWRRQLSEVDLESVYRLGREIISRNRRPKDLSEARALAAELLDKRGSRHTERGLARILPERFLRPLIRAWRMAGAPAVRTFAPYTAHVLTVDLFFYIGIGADLISRQRPSNTVDLAYLYYLPFCLVFTSNDGLHARMVPPFLGAGQEFVSGRDLKADLARLDDHYSALPDEVKNRGVLSFAHSPPRNLGFLVSDLWDRLSSRGPVPPEDAQPPEPMPAAAQKEFIDRVSRIVDAAPEQESDLTVENADQVIVTHWVPARKGKWRMVPPEAMADS